MTRRIRRFPKIPTDEDISKMLEVVMNTKKYPKNNRGMFMRWRDRTILIMYFYCGLRPGECLNLRWKDIDFIKHIIFVQPYFNKQKIDIPAKLTAPAERALLTFKKVCEDMGFHFEFIFPSLDSFEPLSVDRYGRIFREIGIEAGILNISWYTDAGQPKYNYRQYSGRHWFGTEVYRKTHSESAVQAMMRHLSRQSSEPYIHLDDKDKEEIARHVFDAF